MAFFQNFIVAVVIIGILTRVAELLFRKKFKKDISMYLSFLTIIIFIMPLVSIFIGFDIAISEYLIALLIWFLFDLMRISIKGKK